MLTSPVPRRQRLQTPRSLRQEYGEFMLQRIEEFKQQISREELLEIANEAVLELEGSAEQLLLTEVLLLEHVDRLIMQRLNLPSYRRWRTRHVTLRRAQREATHWGLEPHTPLGRYAAEFAADGDALVVGGGATSAALFLAAHDWPVTYIDNQITTVEAAETRAATEDLSGRFSGLVVALGDWFPDLRPVLTVMDPITLAKLDRPSCSSFLETLTGRTPTGGVHIILPRSAPEDVVQFAAESVERHYEGWRVSRSGMPNGSRWFTAVRG